MSNEADCRPDGMTYEDYLAKAAEANVDPLSEEVFKALPVAGKNAQGMPFGPETEGGLSRKAGAKGRKTDKNMAYAKDAGANEDDEDDEEEDMGKTKKAEKAEKAETSEKAMVDPSDLLKAIEAYDAVDSAMAEAGTSRETFLTSRHEAGTITKSERIELGKLWASEEDGPDVAPLQKSLVDVLREDDNAAELVDASPFLKSIMDGVDTRMDQFGTDMARSGRATREILRAEGQLIKSLAVVVMAQGEVIKGLHERQEDIESTPLPRRAVTTPTKNVRQRALAKGVGGDGGGENLTKGDITAGLRTLMMAAVDSRDDAAAQRVQMATAHYESSGELSENMLAAVQQVRVSN